MNADDLKGMNGRRVLVEGVIRDLTPDTLSCTTIFFERGDGCEDQADIIHSAIREILPEPVKVGDRVKWRTNEWIVEAIVERWAALSFRPAGEEPIFYWRPLSDLTLMEPGQ